MRRFACILVFVFISLTVFGQKKDSAKVVAKDSLKLVKKDSVKTKIVFKKYLLSVVAPAAPRDFKMPGYDNRYESEISRKHGLQQVLFSSYDQGYLTASIDSIIQDSILLKAYLSVGDKYEWAYLRKGNLDEGILSQSGYRERLYSGKPFYYKNVMKMMNKVLSIYENHGYPFAKIKLDSIKFQGKQIAAALMIQKQQMEKIDSIVVKGNLKLSPQYLYGYLGIKPGDLYDESKVQAISTRLKALPFLTETKPAQVIFVQSKVKILLYLAKKTANQFNGIVGILPDNSGKITITGDVSLALMNSFHRAEEISFHWQHLQAQTENLTAHLSYPYLFSTPIGVDGDLTIFKQDTTYVQVDSKIGLKYLLIGGDYVKAFFENITSSLLSTSLLQYQTSSLPPYADVTTELYGLEFKANGLDYIYNPRRGYSILVNAAVGTKDIHQNSKLNPQIYDGLQLNSIEYKANLNAAYYIPLFSRSAIKLGAVGGYLNAPSLLLNDLYRIGGFSVLRGFNEQSIYASTYSVGTIEFHYLLEQNSFLFLFFDQGWYQDNAVSPDITIKQDTPFGFGAGMNFQTKAGIFSLSYALGEGSGTPLDFKSGKINFGIINNF